MFDIRFEVHGKPAAVVIGVAGQEMDDVLLQMDPKFWEMIEERRRKSCAPEAATIIGFAGDVVGVKSQSPAPVSLFHATKPPGRV